MKPLQNLLPVFASPCSGSMLRLHSLARIEFRSMLALLNLRCIAAHRPNCIALRNQGGHQQ